MMAEQRLHAQVGMSATRLALSAALSAAQWTRKGKKDALNHNGTPYRAIVRAADA